MGDISLECGRGSEGAQRKREHGWRRCAMGEGKRGKGTQVLAVVVLVGLVVVVVVVAVTGVSH